MHLRSAVFVSGIAWMLMSPAATVTWKGSAVGDWSTASNWSASGGSKVPAAGDDVVIGSGKVVLSAATPHLKSLSMSGSARLEFREPAKVAPANLVTKLWADVVTLADSAVITHITNTMTRAEFAAAGEWKMDGRVWIDCTTLTIDAGAAIDVSSRGYAQFTPSTLGVGPGSATNSVGSIAASHGGMGGVGHNTSAWQFRWYAADHFCGMTYGEAESPVWVGSSGSCSSSSKVPAWSGGGAVKVTASGLVTVNGAIHADSTGNFAGDLYAGGSGGSVWIECGAIAGSGAITADGGQGKESLVSFAQINRIYSGGGGRLAIHYDPSQQDAVTSQSLRFSADSPCRASANYTAPRIVNSPNDVGTVHFTDDRFLRDSFSATVGVGAGEIRCASWTKWHPSSLTVNGAWIRLCEGPATNLTLSGALTVSGIGRLDIGGGIQHCDSRYALTVPPCQRYSCASAPKLSVAALNVSDSGCLRFFSAATNGLDGAIGGTLAVRGDLFVGANGQLILGSHPYCGAPPHVTVGGNATVVATGRVDANGQGFFGAETNGNGRGPGYSWNVNGALRQCASHGGLGSYSGGYGATTCDSTTYGDLRRPTTCGSSGSFSGGGVIWLTVAGHLQLDGLATAVSQHPWSANQNWMLPGYSSGAGGSICLEARTIGGSGQLRANASMNYYYDRHMCGGGRIAVLYDLTAEAEYLVTHPKPTFLYEASPGARGFTEESTTKQMPGDMGSIYLPDAQLLTNAFTSANFRIGEIHLGDWSTWNVGDVTVDGSNIRLHPDGQTIRIAGDVRVMDRSFLGFGGGAYSRRSFRYLSVGEDLGYAAMRLTKGPGPRVEIGGNVELGAGPLTSSYYSWPDSRLAVYAGEEIAVDDYRLGGWFFVRGDLKVQVTGVATGVYELVSHSELGTVVRSEVRNLILDQNAKIDASYRGGRCGRDENERGAPMLEDGKGGGLYSCGGGYGGNGGQCYGTKQVSGFAYGDALWPTNMGGGAGPFGYSGTLNDGFGGGCIWIEARRKMSLAGKVLANGCGSGHTYAASGAGGGIFLKCYMWDPDPSTLKISANGGQRADSNNADGGGGRVAIWRVIDLEEQADPSVSSEDDQGRGYVSVWASGLGNKGIAQPGTIRWQKFSRSFNGFLIR